MPRKFHSSFSGRRWLVPLFTGAQERTEVASWGAVEIFTSGLGSILFTRKAERHGGIEEISRVG